MTAPSREWVTIPVPGKERKQWQIDVTFLMSSWRCIFGQGCQGVLTEPAPELVEGCCSYGAHESEVKVKDKVEKLAKKLGDDEWQFKSIGLKKGVWKKAAKDEWQTRLHKDACIFLNRPDFEGGPGCALHVAALEAGERPMDWKPDVCWQLPLRLEDKLDDEGYMTSTLREWKRRDWGAGGEEFHWWCTDSSEAFVGKEPVYKYLREEIVELIGQQVYDHLVALLERPKWTPLPHPAVKRR